MKLAFASIILLSGTVPIIKSYSARVINEIASEVKSKLVGKMPKLKVTEVDLRRKASSIVILKEKLADSSVFVTIGPLASRAVKENFVEKPLIYIMSSIKDAGERSCGISFDVPTKIQFKQFLRLGRIRKVGVIYNPAGPVADNVAELKREIGLKVVELLTRKPPSEKELEKFFRKIDSLWLLPDPVLVRSIAVLKYIVSSALKFRVKVFASPALRTIVNWGALATVVHDTEKVAEKVEKMVESSLLGKRCRHIYSPLKLIVNKSTAVKLKIKLPTGVEVLH